ncbi:MAG: cytochrome bc complex cytochrome b subunit [Deltaproteobacteria bacterium]|nr:cytochrome bc complex cytochrome b subunit [Deltaproteobacteria bacterium]
MSSQPDLRPGESRQSGNGPVERLKAMFPLDWEIVRHMGAEPIPNHLKKWWFCLGGTILYLFVVQVATGIALTFYYIPTPQEAYASVAVITQELRFGWFIRSLHKWSGNFMIVAVMLHMLRVFFTGAYRHPRQLNWCIGFLLLGTTLTFGFTGYSLVYEQLSFWGATVATNLAEAVPLVGPWIAFFLRGGPEVGENTLTRFFILHIGILPTVVFILIAAHVLMVRLHGVTELRFQGEQDSDDTKHFKFWPDHATTEILIGVLLMYFLTIAALIFPAGLGEPANPNVTPLHIKPEWYFYFNFRLLKLTSLKISVVLTLTIVGIAFFWPFIEEWLRRRWAISDNVPVVLGALAFMIFLVLTVWESFS